MIGGARGRSTSPTLSSKPAKIDEIKKENISTSSYQAHDFPTAPKEEFKSAPPVGDLAASLKVDDEPLIAA